MNKPLLLVGLLGAGGLAYFMLSGSHDSDSWGAGGSGGGGSGETKKETVTVTESMPSQGLAPIINIEAPAGAGSLIPPFNPNDWLQPDQTSKKAYRTSTGGVAKPGYGVDKGVITKNKDPQLLKNIYYRALYGNSLMDKMASSNNSTSATKKEENAKQSSTNRVKDTASVTSASIINPWFGAYDAFKKINK